MAPRADRLCPGAVAGAGPGARAAPPFAGRSRPDARIRPGARSASAGNPGSAEGGASPGRDQHEGRSFILRKKSFIIEKVKNALNRFSSTQRVDFRIIRVE